MNIIIISVYNSYNFGSYFQAYTLQNILSNWGKVYFLRLRREYVPVLKKALRALYSRSFPNAVAYFKQCQKFNTAQDANFQLISRQLICESDIVVIGSDELWNIERSFFKKHKEFWGQNISTAHKISYAPSCNNTTSDTVCKTPDFIENLNTFSAISVRDEYTKKLLEPFVTKDIILTLDPTLLLKKDEYQKIQIPVSVLSGPFILVYSYGNHFGKDEKKAIQDFAASKKLPVFSVGFFLDWCDKTYMVSPFEFLYLMDKAAYVFTDTFHGTVFSVIYEKKFITYSRNNTKVKEIVRMLDISSRDKTLLPDCSIEAIMEQDLDYQTLNTLIQIKRDESLQFLSQNMKFSCEE